MSDQTLDAIKTRIQEGIGAASMCWEPVPTGVFCATAASMIANNLTATVEDWIAAARAPLVAEVKRLRTLARRAGRTLDKALAEVERLSRSRRPPSRAADR